MNHGWSEEALAARVAADLPDGACVNLGIGLPTKVADYLPPGREILLHSENGIIGMGPSPEPGQADPDLVNAGKAPVTLVPGASIVHHADSFAVIRGGRLDIAVLGAMQVSATGDLANWSLPGTRLGSVGGAMDLAVGARRVFVMMRHVDKNGAPKIVERCTYPLTGLACVDRIYTDLAVIQCTPEGLRVIELAPGVGEDELQRATAAPLDFAELAKAQAVS